MLHVIQKVFNTKNCNTFDSFLIVILWTLQSYEKVRSYEKILHKYYIKATLSFLILSTVEQEARSSTERQLIYREYIRQQRSPMSV